ncbi:MAG TPA: hypothetical protein VGG48_03010 [Rhizomicrobium sp.]|jgi:hypothetical protein
MSNLAAALLLVTALGNAPNPNLDAAPPSAQTNVSPAPNQIMQPGPPQDQTIQHGIVDPKGTDAMPLAVKVVSMPPMPFEKPDMGPPPHPHSGGSTIAWVAIAFGAIQCLLMGAVIFFLMQSAEASRRMTEAVERALARGEPPVV